MATATAGQNRTVEHYLRSQSEKSLLRFTTAGSVDDGKSTLIGRLLHDTNGAFEDQIEAVKKKGSGVDFALLTDGLRAEREQGITIDVAYRYFATARRKFIISDTPGHEQYTRNMATGASTADVALILVDARKGLMPQSRRHAYIAALLGIRDLVVVVNKMDLAGFDREVFRRIQTDFQALEHHLRGAALTFIPVSALEGDNVVARSARTPWYHGPSLLELLETIDTGGDIAQSPARLPVQTVLRPHAEFRGFAGQLASGRIRPGDAVIALPSARRTHIERIVTFDGDLAEAFAPMSVTVTLADEIDISRGGLIAAASAPPQSSRTIEAMLVWMSAAPLDLDRTFRLRHGPREVPARVAAISHRVDIGTLQQVEAASLAVNEIGGVVIEATEPLFFDPYRENRRTGAFVLIDPISNLTVAAGMIEGTASAARSLGHVTAPERLRRFGHGPALILVDPASSLAAGLERRLFESGAHVIRLEHPVAPILPLLNAGMIVLADEGPGAHLDLRGSDSANVDQRVDEALAALRAGGVIRTGAEESFVYGEGI